MNPATLALKRYQAAADPEDVFGNLEGATAKEQIKALTRLYYRLAREVHPDTHPGDLDAETAFKLLAEWRSRAESKLRDGLYGKRGSTAAAAADPVTIRSRKRSYENVIPFRRGDICDVYLGNYLDGGAEKEAVLKVLRDADDADLMENEGVFLKELRTSSDPHTEHFSQYLPAVIETLKVSANGGPRKTIRVLDVAKGFISLEEIIAAFPNGLDLQDVAWMWKRMFEILTWVHRQGVVHGAVLPSHVLVHPVSHGLKLIDWSYAVKTGGQIRAISTDYQAYYAPEVLAKKPAVPATDICMATKCAVRLLGGDPASKALPAAVPKPIRGLINICLAPDATARYGDAWEVYEKLNRVLRGLYGPPKYRPFKMV